MEPFNDEQKFLQFYDEYVVKIYRYIYFRVGSEDLAQDLTSDVFLKSWQYLNQTRGPNPGTKKLDNPRAFFYQVARNLITDFHRQKNKEPIALDEITDKKIADKNDGPKEQTEKKLQFEEVKAALAFLCDDYQEIIIWRYLDELEVSEIAGILGKSDGAVRVLISRALSSLKEVLGEKIKTV